MAQKWSLGSQWQRWDVHIHAPGTLFEDAFKNDWDGYFGAISAAEPRPVALGITDYFTLRAYKEFRARRPPGAFPWVRLIFPNIELRLTLQTKDGNGVNLHLLVSPDDPEHVGRMEESLSKLSFDFQGNPYDCNDEGLRRLGRAVRGNPKLEDEAALKEGAGQFKIDLSAIRRLFKDSEWLRSNVLVAVAAGKDGMSGLGATGFKSQRQELGRFANVVFSAQASDRAFWLGEHPGLLADKQRPKPCLHGCDAHSVATVLKPTLDRRTWIRGQATFDSLKETLVEPARRVWIGPTPPLGPELGETIRSLKVSTAPWLKTPDIALNPGLVTVIGSKGSGKTALADLIALATGAGDVDPGPASFIAKALPLLSGLTAEVTWADGGKSEGNADSSDSSAQRVQYLSQQFVDRLSNPSAGPSEPLVDEIERVVFSAIPDEDRLETGSFAELRDLLLDGPHAAATYARETIASLTDIVAKEQALHRSRADLKKAWEENGRLVASLEAEIKSIPVKASDAKVKEHAAAATAVQQLTDKIAKAERRSLVLAEIAAELRRIRSAGETRWNTLSAQYPGVLEDRYWQAVKPTVADGGLKAVDELADSARKQAAALRAGGEGKTTAGGLDALVAARDQLGKELGTDQANAKRKTDLEKKLATERVNLGKAEALSRQAEGAEARVKAAQQERLSSYQQVFQALLQEEAVLAKLYAPLLDRVAADPRLAKLSVVVERAANVRKWAGQGETMFDLRRPPFQGRGALEEVATVVLRDAWTRGTPTDVATAMGTFLSDYIKPALDVRLQDISPQDVGQWLFSTEHIAVRYSIRYEGVPIARLSPGTRGVVLLTLYLGLDTWDVRPLVIDQPEENLDPISVSDDLVPFFREAATRRQIVMVTHNANLVVNTDSDQVIVAKATRPSPTDLPRVTYAAGGLEDAAVRAEVCRILEGGAEAFRKRGERYGLRPET